MDLDTAQRISLIQRNLQAAQVNIDSAVELLNVVIEGLSVQPRNAVTVGQEYNEAPLNLPARLPAPVKRRAKPRAKANTSHQPLLPLILEYARTHGGIVHINSFRKQVQSKGGRIYHYLNDTNIFRKIGNGEFQLIKPSDNESGGNNNREEITTVRVTDAIREFIAQHTGEFTTDMIHNWTTQKQLPFTRKQIQDNINALRGSGKVGIKSDGRGNYHVE